MAPSRSDVEERPQHEGAPMRFRMRQDEPPSMPPARRPTESQSTEIYNIEIKRARPPVNAQAPASPPFELLESP